MNYSFEKRLGIALVAVIGAILIFSAGSYAGKKALEPNYVPQTNLSASSTQYVSKEQFDLFWKAWQILESKSVFEASTTAQDKIYGAIKGLAGAYGDPYTVFFPPEEDKVFQSEIAGSFDGVGMELGIKNNALVVVTPIKNSPADIAGVKSGDIIAKINGKDSLSMSVDDAIKIIRGKKGTPVVITFIRDGASIEKTLIRDTIEIPTLETEKKGDVFIIRLFTFTAQSPDLFRNGLRDFVNSGSHKLIIDLRGNPGGYLDAAVNMASWFLPAGKVIVTEDFAAGSSQNKIYRSLGYDVFNSNLQLAILVDAGSASASEILSGALREQGKAILVGKKTFGKGSVQELVPLTSDTSLKITVARWLTPNGHNLSKDGLDPDYVVDISADDVANKRDPQLDKAIQVLDK